MSFVISAERDNRPLLIPAIEPLKPSFSLELSNVPISYLLKLDLTQLKNAADFIPRERSWSQLSTTSSNSSDLFSARSSISSISSAGASDQDDGFSSGGEEEEEEEKEPSIEPILIKQSTPPKELKRTLSYEVRPSKSKRQRVGPSCDFCRSKKIKCDAHVEIMEIDVLYDLNLTKKDEIKDENLIKKYMTEDELDEGFKLIYSNEKIIKFKTCSYCLAKHQPCLYKRGYTKDDILRYNLANNIRKKKKRSKKR
ncbi:hypothetical protein WICANDRAFT_61351 [Wickerhamomyces anomalus NRRL Y-366-8]|uniref:Zn(2)-C6 fungal-type domain-containing protein n=1 Tax=Wickerhamomyces anomalus (strain ATCC 58044 / CBS 1984 / NCYC 433 / NRRL Y-366-8) TaxID=683960 RepID=A0A1E3P5R0_WICAA|nr:uncharacterized protein WICANDRAFT_61351 [Wickerhamomyces anomalus NRRL Y-366-8]ODQ60786.1 hypothetical protein WICANDRAFT_61351 [Wickerhamomyces anomalus NRRL Y-366-8]